MSDKKSPTRNTKPDSNSAEPAALIPVSEDLPAYLDGVEYMSFDGLGLGVRTVNALNMMLTEGISLDLAAQRAGLYVSNLRRAFNSPKVRAVYNQHVKAIMDNAAIQAFIRIEKLTQTSKSDQVRLEGNKWLAGVGNIAPIKRVEGRFQHNHSFEGFDYGADPVDVTPDEDC